MSTLMENVELFSKTLLQKLYRGTFVGDPESLLNFLADQIVVVRNKKKINKSVKNLVIFCCLDKPFIVLKQLTFGNF